VLGEDDSDLREQLRANPLGMFAGPCLVAGLDHLEVLAGDVRPEIRRAACAALHRVLPRRSRSVCGSGGVGAATSPTFGVRQR
jgi:hypothetical protein